MTTNPNYSFDPKRLVREIGDIPNSKRFTSWLEAVRVLARRHFNVWEAEAILCSLIPQHVTREVEGKASSADFAHYLDHNEITHGCAKVNVLVMKRFGEEYKLELNDRGQPCRRGTMPGNYDPMVTTLVPLGTPACCNPHTEQYWSM